MWDAGAAASGGSAKNTASSIRVAHRCTDSCYNNKSTRGQVVNLRHDPRKECRHMDQEQGSGFPLGRRNFLKATGAGIGATGLALVPAQQAAASPLTEKQKLDRVASNTWPLRYIFKSRMKIGRAH